MRAGHALYEQGRNLGPEWEGLPVNSALSMGIHESQSLFWERMVSSSSSSNTRLHPHRLIETRSSRGSRRNSNNSCVVDSMCLDKPWIDGRQHMSLSQGVVISRAHSLLPTGHQVCASHFAGHLSLCRTEPCRFMLMNVSNYLFHDVTALLYAGWPEPAVC